MPRYHYEATDRRGKPVIGSMEAPDEGAVRARLTQGGYKATLIESSGGAKTASAALAAERPREGEGMGARPGVKVSTKELATFYRQMATAVRSGMALTQVVPRLRERSKDRLMRRALEDVEAAVARGRPISEAMRLHPRVFRLGHVGLVHAGEGGGFLDKALDELATQSEADWGVEAATRFNIMLFIIKWVGIPFLAAWVYVMLGIVPMISGGLTVDIFTRIAIGGLLAGAVTAGVLNGVLPLLWRGVRGTRMGDVLDNVSSRIPFLNARRRRVDEVKALSSLASAMAAGVPSSIAWQLASEAPDTPVFRQAMASQNSLVRQGAPLPDVLTATRLFDDDTLGMVRSGEESGNMPEMLAQAIHYKREEAKHIGNLTPWLIAMAAYFILLLIGAALFIWAASNVYGGIIDAGLDL